MPEDSILEKVRALLRLSKSDNPHEAQLAMQRAMEIATRHCIDLESVADEAGIKLHGRKCSIPLRLAREYKEALNTVNTFFNVSITVLSRRGQILIVGTEQDIELAEYLITYLVRSCRQCLEKYRVSERAARRKTTGSKIASYIDGFFTGIYVVLRDQRAAMIQETQSLAIVLADNKEARETERNRILGPGSKLSTITAEQVRNNRQARFSGFVDGKNTQLNPGLKGHAPKPALN